MITFILAVSTICVFGDNHPLSDRCFAPHFEVSTIVECRTLGESVPPNVNTGDRNPGRGMVTFGFREFDGSITVLQHFAYEARGYSSFRPDNALVYIVNDDLISVDGMEACDLLEGHE